MEIEFRCIEAGRKLFSIRRQGEEIFVGTEGECRRFLEIHTRKVLEERENDLKVQRQPPFVVRTYRRSKMA
jgi:hypothetical protein